MRNIRLSAKYTLHEIGFAILQFVILFLIIDLLAIVFSRRETLGLAGEITLMPLLLASLAGMIYFQYNFNFNLANSVTRSEYLTGYLIASFLIALPLSGLDWLLLKIAPGPVDFNVFDKLFQMNRFLPWFCFNFSLITLTLVGSFFLGLLFYRRKIKEFLAILLALGLFTALVDRITAGIAGKKLLLWIFRVLGLEGTNLNPLLAAASFLVLTGSLIALNYLLIGKAELKN